MQAIYSSKLYRTSRRKSKISAAISDPINVELVQQLSEYLDEPEKDEPVVDEVTNETEETSPDTTESDEMETSETSAESSPFIDDSGISIQHSSSKSNTTESSEPAKDEDSTVSEPEISEPKEKENAEPKEIEHSRSFHAPSKKENSESSEPKPKEEKPDIKESSTSSESTVEESVSVEAATTLYQQPVQSSCCIADHVDVEAIRGTLNIRDDTKGVARIQIRENENELWIYYQDKINLNSVMEPVIEVLNSATFTNLEFNRLARTDNAIVFEISPIFQDVKPMNSENE